MNKSLLRLAPLRKLAQTREDNATQRWRERQRLLAQAEARLAELRGYLSEYEQRGSRSDTGAQWLQNRHAFILRLRQAEALQQQSVVQAQKQAQAEQAQWLAQRQRRQVLDRLARRYQFREQREAEHRAQKHQDELATRISLLSAAQNVF